MRRRGRGRAATAVVAAAIGIALAVGGGAWLVAGGPGGFGGSTDAGAPSSGMLDTDAVEVLSQLDDLPEVDGRSDRDYDRDLFGQSWADVDRNGCDTRNDILGRDLLDATHKDGTEDCKVLTGTLIDPYDGTVVEFVSGPDTSVLVQIDHVVALSWAWHHGADRWDDERREVFANDPRNLVASSEATNQAKSAFGPGEWLPPDPDLRCGYVAQFVDVVSTYDLGIGDADRAAARAVLERCG